MTSLFTFESKARTLEKIAPKLRRFHVPDFLYFSVQAWTDDQEKVVERIASRFRGRTIIIRSSTCDEDGAHWGLAGQYESIPHVLADDKSAVRTAVESVIASYNSGERKRLGEDEVIVQEMVRHVVMSGVLFTHDLNTGARYYVINYDDESGRTDTVTSGGGEYANRTLYIHRGALSCLRSERFKVLIAAIEELESVIGNIFLDVEFALDEHFVPYLFQVRLITTQTNWNRGIASRIDEALSGVQDFVRRHLRPIPGILGKTTVLGQMPDWNPAEMIGRAPRALALSLYRRLITDHAWRQARATMGYAAPEGQPLMLSLAGQPFIDTRLSFNSYLPAGLPKAIGEKLVDAWLARLRAHPHLHDKVEFDVAITAFGFDIDERIDTLIPGVLDAPDRDRFKEVLRAQTRSLLAGELGSMKGALADLRLLQQRQNAFALEEQTLPDQIATLTAECVQYGTIPFAMLARHAFIAKSLLISLEKRGVFSSQDVHAFQASIRTIASDIVVNTRRLARGEISRDLFMADYGHLRPGTYDILSPRYDQTEAFSCGAADVADDDDAGAYAITPWQKRGLESLLVEAKFDGVDAESLVEYLRAAPAAREYGKFIFTRTISDILEVVASFGENNGLSRDEMSHIPIDDILEIATTSSPLSIESRLRRIAEENADGHLVTAAIRLPQVLFDEEGVHVIPFQISHPNFITRGTVRAPCIRLHAHASPPSSLEGMVVLIENADPGFDWIFAHRLGGLVTKYGGVNSHMAIRCAEFRIPAAIGCGEQIFNRIESVGGVEINCGEGHIRPVKLL